MHCFYRPFLLFFNDGAGREFRDPDLRIMVMIARFALTFPVWESFLDETIQVRRSAAELYQHICLSHMDKCAS